ncbi:MAG: guanylate kinase [Candidatus Desulfofervidaceae bacterium]|nr:guanylate kinase [Candidatus Desulfofervidaceae bacterium]MDL1969553.1 guanylate kinase [Candidatus Desulfofervidaceae bacterium]
MKNKIPGDIFVISAPSGTGKTTLTHLLLSCFPSLNFSISYTTRPPRPGEKDGVDYFFVSRRHFEQMISQGEMLEWAEVYGNYYGTSVRFLREKINAGKDILLDIDVQGARQVRRLFPQAVLIFIIPPSWEELEKRLKKRATDAPEEVKRRLTAAREEIKAAREFDYIVINESLDQALQELKGIILATKANAKRRWPQVSKLFYE